MSRQIKVALLASALLCLLATPQRANCAPLVASPFLNGYQGWTDPATARLGDWRLNLLANTVMETSDQVPAGSNPASVANNGSYNPSLLIQNNYTTPSKYDLNARMYSVDDDGWGLIFGYQDVDNYYRVFFRAQASGSLGGTVGTSVQKVVGGVATQISPNGLAPGNTAFPTLAMVNAPRAPFDIKVSVDGTNYAVYVAGINGGNPLQSGSDPGLAAGKVGIQSWAQRFASSTQDNPFWGTEAETVTVSDVSGTLYNGNFENPTKWRSLAMANAAGTVRTNNTSLAAIIGDDQGDFGASIATPWIYQKSNGFEYATGPTGSAGAQANPFDHIDFLGPAAVIDEPGSGGWGDYELKVRMGATDNDGIGVIMRAKDNDNFYRINFSSQTVNDATNSRAPQGLSIQKVKGGVWSEVFRDTVGSPLFVYTSADSTAADDNRPDKGMPMFDLRVRMIGNTFDINVVDHLGNVIQYPLITDSSDPILSGTVGLTTWGTENVYWMPYGNDPNSLFLIEIPEPAMVGLLLMAAVCIGPMKRRRSC